MQFLSFRIRYAALGALLLGLASCHSKNNDDPSPALPYTQGVLVVNEGNFLDNNGSITLLNRTNQTATYDIFQKENSRSLAGGVAGYTEADDKGVILVDNSTPGLDKVEVVNASTFKSIATVSGVENPRQAVRVGSNKVYITCWDSFNADYSYKPGYVAVLDLTTNQITGKIPVQSGCQDIVVIGTEAFVGNIYTGGTTLSVIDLTKDAVSQTLEAGSDPSSLRVDANTKLWFYADGNMVRLNPQSKAIETRIPIGSTGNSGSLVDLRLSQDKQTFYLIYNYSGASSNSVSSSGIYRFNINDTSISADKALINRRFSGGLGVDPQTGTLYASIISPSYKQAGYVYRYQSNGTLIDSVRAEITPTQFYFK